MGRWLKRVRGAVTMGFIWALVWAPVALLAGLVIDPDNSMDEMWPLIGAYPGFIGGVIFSIVLAIAARRRRLEELSVPRFAAWGALAGLMVGLVPFTIGDAGPGRSIWLIGGVFLTATTLLSAGCAAGSLALARRAEERPLIGGGPMEPLTRSGAEAHDVLHERG